MEESYCACYQCFRLILCKVFELLNLWMHSLLEITSRGKRDQKCFVADISKQSIQVPLRAFIFGNPVCVWILSDACGLYSSSVFTACLTQWEWNDQWCITFLMSELQINLCVCFSLWFSFPVLVWCSHGYCSGCINVWYAIILSAYQQKHRSFTDRVGCSPRTGSRKKTIHF